MTWIVPILALLVSAIGVILAYIVSTRNRPGLKITVGKEEYIDGAVSTTSIFLSLVNTGDVPIGIQKVGLEFGTRINHFSVGVEDLYPITEITKGQPQRVYVDVADDVDKKQLLWAWAKDTTGKQFRSKIIPYIKAD